MKKIIGILVLGCVLIGCTTSRGLQIDPLIVSQITEGVTTEGEVMGLFGEPLTREENDEGKVILTYDYTHLDANKARYYPVINMMAGKFTIFKQSLAILFNEQGTVEKYLFYESNGNEIRYRDGYKREVFWAYEKKGVDLEQRRKIKNTINDN